MTDVRRAADGLEPLTATVLVKGRPVILTWTRCNFGGMRPWFICLRCGARVALLYGSVVPCCRTCARIVYPSTREDRSTRAHRKVERLRARLGVSLWPGRSAYVKPKRMRWSTFNRLVEQIEDAELAALAFGLADITRNHELARQAEELLNSTRRRGTP